ncbi:pyridoxal-phosphate dependent enzyme domain-containing protein [Hirsutella rhossiliensis]|uniref:Pyridoxal-phosphate dependent enzyme domain-containing protein n=1 Tax=Hirsutella rhossiliensis TaxID=111463 RepID=A0A9P8MUC4_9HYPO|nr:pyridoxal-phosphate dependent enzyme domain-containing protein [Hirsutella rhossiliensis]KAH0962288.1 pyridoxal-phosphate dependent enzyme domain-containing protein [Hirsutella rhossiliensis]
MNVFKGPESLTQYYDPDQNPPLPLVEIPKRLNPLREDGVRIFAKILTALPAQNVKSLPVLNMLQQDPDIRSKPLAEASSGSTAISLGVIARALWGHEDVHAHVSNKKPISQMKLLRLFGISVDLFGGMTQPTYDDPKGIMGRLRNRATQKGDIFNPGQYHNENNWKSHIRWTGPQIVRQLPEINVFSATVGTGGCVVGNGKYIKAKKPSTTILGVFNAHGDTTPGPRHLPGMDCAPFAQEIFETIDCYEIVKSVDSFRTSMSLCRNGIICGPSSGEALHGLLAYLKKQQAAGRLGDLAEPETGETNCVFICADLPYQYVDLYHAKLPEDEFPKIYNEELLACDLDVYDDRYHLTPPLLIDLLDRGNLITSIFCQGLVSGIQLRFILA